MPTQGHSLIDIQSSPDTRGIALQKVGVKDVTVPLNIVQKDGHSQMVSAKVTMSVDLPATEKGTHLSRFIIQLAENSRSKAFCYNLKDILQDTVDRLGSQNAFIKIDFPYFIERKSPVSEMLAPMAYNCSFSASLMNGQYDFALGLDVPITTLCPCSKAISKYGAHNQRASIEAQLRLDTQADHEVLWIEDLVASLEECGSCPVYPILKREDEKYVTERAYENPKFVEDVIRESIKLFQSLPTIVGYEIKVEAFESIHGHNAWAYQKENM